MKNNFILNTTTMLKNDLLNEIRNEKYFAELELNRLAMSTDIPYREKLAFMCEQLSVIDRANKRIELVNLYFGTEQVQNQNAAAPRPAPAPMPEPEPQSRRKPIEGQSHAE